MKPGNLITTNPPESCVLHPTSMYRTKPGVNAIACQSRHCLSIITIALNCIFTLTSCDDRYRETSVRTRPNERFLPPCSNE